MVKGETQTCLQICAVWIRFPKFGTFWWGIQKQRAWGFNHKPQVSVFDVCTEIPLDSITKNQKLSENQLEDRKLFWNALDKRVGTGKGGPHDDLKGENVKQKMFGVSEIVFMLCGSRIDRALARSASERYHDLRLPSDCHIEGVWDFAEYVWKSVSSNDLRNNLFFALYGAWGTMNDWADEAESEIMDLLGLRYTDKLSSGKFRVVCTCLNPIVLLTFYRLIISPRPTSILQENCCKAFSIVVM